MSLLLRLSMQVFIFSLLRNFLKAVIVHPWVLVIEFNLLSHWSTPVCQGLAPSNLTLFQKRDQRQNFVRFLLVTTITLVVQWPPFMSEAAHTHRRTSCSLFQSDLVGLAGLIRFPLPGHSSSRNHTTLQYQQHLMIFLQHSQRYTVYFRWNQVYCSESKLTGESTQLKTWRFYSPYVILTTLNLVSHSL